MKTSDKRNPVFVDSDDQLDIKAGTISLVDILKLVEEMKSVKPLNKIKRQQLSQKKSQPKPSMYIDKHDKNKKKIIQLIDIPILLEKINSKQKDKQEITRKSFINKSQSNIPLFLGMKKR